MDAAGSPDAAMSNAAGDALPDGAAQVAESYSALLRSCRSCGLSVRLGLQLLDGTPEMMVPLSSVPTADAATHAAATLSDGELHGLFSALSRLATAPNSGLAMADDDANDDDDATATANATDSAAPLGGASANNAAPVAADSGTTPVASELVQQAQHTVPRAAQQATNWAVKAAAKRGTIVHLDEAFAASERYEAVVSAQRAAAEAAMATLAEVMEAGPEVAAIAALVLAGSGTVRQNDGQTLHQLLMPTTGSQIDWDAVLIRVCSHPEEASIESRFDYSDDEDVSSPLLRVATDFGADVPLGVVASLVVADRSCLFRTTQREANTRRTLLHMLAGYDVSPRLIRFLCSVEPDLPGRQCNRGMVPLHCMSHPLSLDASLDTFRTLLDCFPDAISVRDINGKTVMHHAAVGVSSKMLEVIRVLVEKRPDLDLVYEWDKEGRMPIDITLKTLESGMKCPSEPAYGNGIDIPIVRNMLHFLEEQMDRRAVSQGTRFCLLCRALKRRRDPAIIRYILSKQPNPHELHGELCRAAAVRLASKGGYDYTSVIKPLLDECPAALNSTDPESRLYPFMLAAVGSGENSLDSLNSSYMLLKENPMLVIGTAEGGHM